MKKLAGILVMMAGLSGSAMAHGGLSLSFHYGDYDYRPYAYRSYSPGYRPYFYSHGYGGPNAYYAGAYPRYRSYSHDDHHHHRHH